MSETAVGKIISVSELNIQVLINDEKIKYRDILYTNSKGRRIEFEVVEEDGNVISAIPFQNVVGFSGLESRFLTSSLPCKRASKWAFWVVPA